MVLLERDDIDCADGERPVDLIAVDDRPVEALDVAPTAEQVVVAVGDEGQRRGCREGLDIMPDETLHHAQVVDTVDVIGMFMGVEHRIDLVDVGIQQLVAEVRRGVDQHRRAAGLDQDRRPAAAVLRVVRVAHAPPVADRGHPARRPAAKHPHPHEATVADAAVGASALVNRRKKFSVEMRANSSAVSPLSSATLAAVCTT